MKQKNLWLTVGMSGSGKTHFIHENFDKLYKAENLVIVSRDNIRFALLKDNEDYFSHEPQVWNEYIKQLKEAIEDETVTDVIADATHLNTTSRNKVINALNLPEEVNINFILGCVPIEVCQERNKIRTGRAIVPEEVIYQQERKLWYPDYYEIRRDRTKYIIIFDEKEGQLLLNERIEYFDV